MMKPQAFNHVVIYVLNNVMNDDYNFEYMKIIMALV